MPLWFLHARESWILTSKVANLRKHVEVCVSTTGPEKSHHSNLGGFEDELWLRNCVADFWFVLVFFGHFFVFWNALDDFWNILDGLGSSFFRFWGWVGTPRQQVGAGRGSYEVVGGPWGP